MRGSGRGRFGVRAMLGIVAIAALGSAVLFVWGPLVYRRARIDAILRKQYDDFNPMRGFLSSVTPEYQRLRAMRPDEYALLRSQPRTVARRLLRSIEAGDSSPTDRNKRRDDVAATLLDEWLIEVDSVAIAGEFRDRLFALTMEGKLGAGAEARSIMTVASLTSRLGLDDDRRARVRAKVRELATRPGQPSMALWGWAAFAESIGGREELDLFFELARSPDREIVGLFERIGLRATRWPGMLERARRLIADPGPIGREAVRAVDTIREVASPLDEWALGLPILVVREEGREFLLAYAEDDTHPIALRRKAIHILKRDAFGLALLIRACDDPKRRPAVAALFGNDTKNLVGSSGGDTLDLDNWPIQPYATNAADPADPRPELKRLLAEHDRECNPWRELIQDAEPGQYAGGFVDDQPREGDPGSRSMLAIRRLEALVPPPRPKTPAEWFAWFKANPPPPIAWSTWFAALEKVPDDRSRLDHPYGLLTVPADCIPILARMARSSPGAFHAGAAQLLLIKSERADEAPMLFDLIEARLKRDPDKLSARDPEIIRTLRRRFAVNFFWDADAWRAWWAGESSRTQGRSVL
jgi:hypothetical protein